MRARALSTALVCLAVGAGVAATPAAALTGCSSNAASAIDQYCESIPSSNGGPTPFSLGGAPLWPTLTRSFVNAIIRSRKHSGLLTIPAPYRPASRGLAPAPAVSVFALLRTLILIIVALAISLAAIAWRQHTGNRRIAGTA
jgi:hypothetical protein